MWHQVLFQVLEVGGWPTLGPSLVLALVTFRASLCSLCVQARVSLGLAHEEQAGGGDAMESPAAVSCLGSSYAFRRAPAPGLSTTSSLSLWSVGGGSFLLFPTSGLLHCPCVASEVFHLPAQPSHSLSSSPSVQLLKWLPTPG
jgi:hypothetical protein